MKWITPLLASAGALGAAGIALLPQEKADSDLKVTLYLSIDCPVAARYSPRLEAMHEEFNKKGVEFEAWFPNEGDSPQEVATYMHERSLNFPADLDLGAAKAKASDVEILPTAILTDADGKVLYHGAIDDNKVSDLVKNHYLRDALEAAVAGKPVPVKTSEPFGCYVMPSAAVPDVAEVTYAEHVKPIIDEHCVECHRPGETAPFSLVGYDNARKWNRMIADVTQEGIMPPWLAVEGIGEFHDENRLSPQKLQTLQNWSAAKAPRGDASKEQPDPTYPTGWELGEPDLLLTMPEEFDLGAEGADEYWNFVLDPKLDKPVYVKAMDVKPGNRTVVHHVIAFVDAKNRSARMLERPGARKGGYKTFGGVGFAPDSSFGGWAPGVRPRLLPEGAAFVLNPGDKVVLQVHYHKSGKPETDQTQVALYTEEVAPTRKVDIAWLANPLINIQPGKKDQRFSFTYPIPADIIVYTLMPHMHLLGQEMKATVIHPDGKEEPVIHVDDWDFNWQLVYQLKEPMLVKKGSRIRLEAWYDNTADNPNNPNNPPKRVTWGEATDDEMMLLVASFALADAEAAKSGSGLRGLGFGGR